MREHEQKGICPIRTELSFASIPLAAFLVPKPQIWRSVGVMVTFQTGGIVLGGQLPDVGVHGDGLGLVQGKQADASCHLL